VKLKTVFTISVICLLWLIQANYSLNTGNEIRLEELSESIRNVYWLENKTIYDGISSNVGWYGTLLILYKIVGFGLFYAKFFRLGVHFLFLLCLYNIFKNYFSEKRLWLPLIIIGLSPTLLYFNTLQTSFGIDLQYFPFYLYLLLKLNFKKTKKALVIQFLLWTLAMITWMSYPSFLALLPFLVLIFSYKVWLSKKYLNFWKIGGNVLFSILSFLLPFILVLGYLKDPLLLISDPRTKSGIFRGGGVSLPTSALMLWNNVISGSKQVIKDLFTQPSSFYYDTEILRAEFSHPLTKLSVVTIFFLSSIIIFSKIKNKNLKKIIVLSGLLIPFTLFISNISDWFPGLRRSTPVLIGFYILLAIVWHFASQFKFKNHFFSFMGLIACLLIFIHHFKVYRSNFAGLKQISSPHAQDGCFNIFPESPKKSLDYYVKQVKKTGFLNISSAQKNDRVCRLVQIYSATAGSCEWNQLNCPQIMSFNEDDKSYFLLSTKLWEDYHLPH